MKKIAIFACFLLVLSTTIFAAGDHTETYFKFRVNTPQELEKLTRIISIDNVQDGVVHAYANEKEIEVFKTLGYDYEVLPHPGTLIDPVMTDSKDGLKDWDTYPTYEAYVDQMNQFAIDYPDLCQIVNAGNSVEGRQVLFAKISHNVGVEEDEPEVMFTGTMHGDETTGYVLMIRLIDSLLTGYGNDANITRLVDSMDIWINPAANPDGTYAGGNSSVSGSTRYNANGVDLNRNFHDPEDGEHPDGNSYQPETIAMMNIAAAQNFIISANFHGGAEVLNYPWDTWVTRHADDQWWQDVCRTWADSAHAYAPSGYLSDLNNGITNGYDWYTTSGCRQDYMNYFQSCREMTAELSGTKLLPASQLPAHWVYNRIGFVMYLENALFGIRGIVTDAGTGDPVAAMITTLNHDNNNAQVRTDPDVGDYHRMLEAGTYDLVFSAPGYFSDTVTGISVVDRQATRVDVQLTALPDDPFLTFAEYDGTAAYPDDDASINITLNNLGAGIATGVVGVLSSTDEFITVTQATSAYPTINALGGEATSITAYEFHIDSECPLFHEATFMLSLTDDDTYSDDVTFSYLVGDRIVIFADDFSSNQGWTGLGGVGEWTIGACVGGGTSGRQDPTEDHSSSGDNQVLGNDLTSAGTYNDGIAEDWAYSPVIDCGGRTGVELRYWHWLGCESSTYDHAKFDVFDGDSWINLFSNGSTSQATSWTEAYYDLSAYADDNPGFQMRWSIGPTDGSGVYSGWNIDDIELKGYGSSGGSPVLALSPTSVIDSLQPGDQGQAILKVKNTGDGSLGVWFSSANSWLSFSKEKQTVPAGDSLELEVTILTAGLVGGDHVGSIDYTSNDAGNASGYVPVTLHIFVPDISIGETSIAKSLNPDETDTYALVIDNDGPGRLIYQVGTQMDMKSKSSQAVTAIQELGTPIGYRTADGDKGGTQEPFYAAQTKGSGGPDAFGYTWIDSDEPGGPVFDWIDITTLGTEVTLSDDNYVPSYGSPLAIGFDFPFYDSLYSSLYIGSNGLISFDTGYGRASGGPLPDDNFTSYIGVWHDDLDPPEVPGHVYYYHDAANGRFIVSYVNVRNYVSPTGTGDLSFQVILYPNGQITMQYDVMDPGADTEGLASATIGIQNSDRTDALQILYNAAYMHNQLAIQIGAASWLSANPTSGTVDPYGTTTVNLLFDASGLEIGDYTGNLTIICNDPDTPAKDIPVTLTVSTGCCTGPSVGNVDGSVDNLVTMSDLTVLIDHLFISLDPLTCVAEGNTDISEDELVTMSDLTVLIDHLFISLNPLPTCP